MDPIIETLPVTEYNSLAEIRWNEAWKVWKPEKSSGEPFIGCYLFFDDKGQERTRGYVASVIGKDYHFYAKTKAAIQKALVQNSYYEDLAKKYKKPPKISREKLSTLQ